MVLLGHASIDERGRAAGGAAGDQTGKELCTRPWYDKGWDLLLRPATAELAERSAAACEAACANPHIGYDQKRRNTLYEKSKKVEFDLAAIGENCACDCSSLMHVCAIAGGADIPYEGNGCTTRTMADAFPGSGDYIRLTGAAYLKTDGKLLRGDILVKKGSHTAMVLGQEEKTCALSLPQLAAGSRKDAVKAMQQLLTARGYPCGGGAFDAGTEASLKAFQADMNLLPDGICGQKSWGALLYVTGVG